MKIIFDQKAYEEILERLENLSENHEAKWGKMNVSQMLIHLEKPIKLALGEESIQKAGFFMKIMVKFFKPTLYNDKPWKKGLPTAKEFIITDTADFDEAKQRLKQLISRVHKSEDHFKPSRNHPVFGKMEHWMWGQSAYKHLDHHFKQFGV